MNERTDETIQRPARRHFLARLGQGLGAAAAIPLLPAAHAGVAETAPGCVTDHLPGRLGNPDITIATDPRLDPRARAMIKGMAEIAQAPPPIGPDAPIADIRELFAAFETEGLALHEEYARLPPVDGVARRTEVINGVDGNAITLHIVEPAKRDGPAPGIVHTHGGGMTFFTAEDAPYVRWRDELAAAGLVVVGVDFRNAAGRLGCHPFPAGLNDCASATRWTYRNRETLAISHLVVSGESGGGNLCLATALKARQEGWLDEIAGIYACCPYIAGEYDPPLPELVSWRENGGYMMTAELSRLSVLAYDPAEEHVRNPLAWPYHATSDDLAGLPPHVVSVNELDPLRDEGLIYARKLMAAGVTTHSRTVNGTGHGADTVNPHVLPNVYYATIRDIRGFAAAL